MTSREGLDAVLLAEAPEAADLDRFYGERRHRSLFEFAALCEAGCAVTATRRCCAGAGGAEARSAAARANPARGNLPALLSCVRVERSFFLWTGMPHE